MDQNRRIECGKIKQSRIGQLFFVCQTCFLEYVSLESFTLHRIEAHGGNQSPGLHQSSGMFDERAGPQKLVWSSRSRSSSQIARPSDEDVLELYASSENEECNSPCATPTARSNDNIKQSNPSRDKCEETLPNCATSSGGTSKLSPSGEAVILRKKFKCSFCLRKFNTLIDFDSHKATGQCKLKIRINCNYCDKTFVSAAGLRYHIHRHHKSALPYACSVCPKSFNRRIELMIHRKNHNKNAEFKCKFCDKRCLSEYEKINHVRQCHQIFQCDECLFESKYEAVVRRHQVTHHKK